MLSFVFCAMVAAGFAAALLLGRLELLSAAMLESGQDDRAKIWTFNSPTV